MKKPIVSSGLPLRFSRHLLAYSLILTTVAACSSTPKIAKASVISVQNLINCKRIMNWQF